MTWVVGMPGVPGGGLLLSDVRVTLKHPDGSSSTFDGLQKICPLAPWIAAGFAGSVDVGFFLLGDFQSYIGSTSPGMVAMTGHVLSRWRRRASNIYESIPEPMRALGCELLFIGASADVDILPGFAMTYGYILRAPDFELERIGFNKAESVGSGGAVPQYLAVLQQSDDENFSLWKIDLEMGGMAHLAFVHGLTTAIERHYERTVSEHLLVLRVTRGAFRLANNDRDPLPPGKLPARTMPPLATTPQELYRMTAALGYAGALAKA